MQFINYLWHVAAGLTTTGFIWAVRNRRSIVLLFTTKARHLEIHIHYLLGHKGKFRECSETHIGDAGVLVAEN